MRSTQNPHELQFQMEERNLLEEYSRLANFEETFYKEKSRIKWMKEGDKNTNFFHRTVKVHNARNKILRLSNENGDIIEDYSMIETEVTIYFEKLFTEPNPSELPCQNWPGRTLTDAQGHTLSQLVTKQEIKEALFSINSNSAPGPDGYTAVFFKDNWVTIENDFTEAIEYFFKQQFMYYHINATSISLIPKTENPTKMKDFRPISFCNVTYKVITKILANRLKPLLPSLISDNQSAFVKGRTIQSNILLVHELVKNYKKADGPKCCAIKVDIMKAFDTVNWQYLLSLLRLMHFPYIYIKWVELCITTPTFSVNLNGSLTGNFKSSRGLRQGDPLSPYLFILVMEGLTQMLKHQTSIKNFSFHPRCGNENITSLAFADDLFIFSKADLHSVTIIKQTLEEFQKISGLKPNLQKSMVFSSGLNSQKQAELAQVLGMQIGTLPIKYLGLPLTMDKLSFVDCCPLLDRLTTRVTSWANKNLSYGGRVLLFNSVLTAICRYWTASFFLPRKIIKEIERILKGFLWGSTRKAKIKWSTICQPKERGGLGIHDLHLTNDAYIMKNLWDICQGKECLWVKWIHTEILKGKSVWEVKPRPSDSWLWKKMLGVRSSFRENVRKVIGDGTSSSFWYDPWHPWGILDIAGSNLRRKLHITDNARVSSVIVNYEWRIPFGRGWDEEVRRFSVDCFGVRRKRGKDEWAWLPSSTFTIKEAIKTIQVQQPLVPWRNTVWGEHSVPRYVIILWMACWNRLNTLDKLHSWGLTTSNICVFCSRAVETHEHLFFQCSFSFQIWNSILSRLKTSFRTFYWQDILMLLRNKHSRLQLSLASLGLASSVYHIWRERNNRIFKQTRKDINTILKETLDSMSYTAASWKGHKCNRQNWELSLELRLPQTIFTKHTPQGLSH